MIRVSKNQAGSASLKRAFLLYTTSRVGEARARCVDGTVVAWARSGPLRLLLYGWYCCSDEGWEENV